MTREELEELTTELVVEAHRIGFANGRYSRDGIINRHSREAALLSLAPTRDRKVGMERARAVLVQAVENVVAQTPHRDHIGAAAVLREYDRLMRRLSDDESEKSAENPPSEPNHG